jgi:hypothetical protein
MKVEYYPKDWRPNPELENEILHLFTILHVVEPVEELTLKIVHGTQIRFDNDDLAWAAYCGEMNTILLPACYHKDVAPCTEKDWNAFVLWNLQHEYVHAIRKRDGRDTGHRGFENEMLGLYNRILRET